MLLKTNCGLDRGRLPAVGNAIFPGSPAARTYTHYTIIYYIILLYMAPPREVRVSAENELKMRLSIAVNTRVLCYIERIMHGIITFR